MCSATINDPLRPFPRRRASSVPNIRPPFSFLPSAFPTRKSRPPWSATRLLWSRRLVRKGTRLPGGGPHVLVARILSSTPRCPSVRLHHKYILASSTRASSLAPATPLLTPPLHLSLFGKLHAAALRIAQYSGHWHLTETVNDAASPPSGLNSLPPAPTKQPRQKGASLGFELHPFHLFSPSSFQNSACSLVGKDGGTHAVLQALHRTVTVG